MIASLWDKCWGGIVLLIAVTAMAIGLCAEDVPLWVMKGIAAVETSSDYRGPGDVRGKILRGKIGEVGPWQLSPSVLRDLDAYDQRVAIHADAALAEAFTRAWLTRLRSKTGSWHEAIAAYHAGMGKRSHPFAIMYADRVCNLRNIL